MRGRRLGQHGEAVQVWHVQVEQHEVGAQPFCDQSTIGQADAIGRSGSQPRHGFFYGDQPLLQGVPP